MLHFTSTTWCKTLCYRNWTKLTMQLIHWFKWSNQLNRYTISYENLHFQKYQTFHRNLIHILKDNNKIQQNLYIKNGMEFYQT